METLRSDKILYTERPFLWSNGKPDCGIYVVNF